MNIALFQYSPIWESKEINFKLIQEYLTDSFNIDLLIFPEMTLTGFTMNTLDNAENLGGKTCSLFKELAIKLNTDIMFGMVEESEGVIFNSLIHIDESGNIKSSYRKIHPFSMSKENKYFTAGNDIVITDVKGVKIGLSICYDLRFPELYRLYGKEKVEILVNIANWPIPRINHWKTLLKARAIENQAFMIGVNRTGNDPGNDYNGSSSVYDFNGDCLLEGKNEDKIYKINIDINEIYSFRKSLPFLDDIKMI